MQFKQFYLGCLSHASYYVGSGDEAAVIDPQRDIQQYLDEASEQGQAIKYIIETHSHADFVSGHTELAAKTGAQIVFGARAETAFATLKVKDGDLVSIGSVELSFLETPGHTPEGITIVAKDTANVTAPLKMFTGDTLFIGDVGRPDLIGSKGFTAEQMGGMLYDSLHEKLLKFPDETEVYPAHGAGSLCGKSLSKETWSTLGNQRKFNYALQPMTKEKFIEIVASDQPTVPAYFPKSAERNLEGPASLDSLSRPVQFSDSDMRNFKGTVIDIRQMAEFGAAHVPSALNVGLGGQFATWSGTFVAVGTPVVIAAKTNAQVEEAFMRLARVGIETVVGFVLMDEYNGPTNSIEQIAPDQVNEKLKETSIQFVDVRQPGERVAGHAIETVNLPLNAFDKDRSALDPDLPTYVICQSGYRSSLATSILERAGFKNVSNVAGGTSAWIEAGLPIEKAAEAAAN
jgi:hydroxyacylglutathione hydrolase